MEMTAIYWIIMFLVIGVIQLSVLIMSFLINKNKKGASSIAIIGILLFVSSIVIGINFVSAFSNQEKGVEINSLEKEVTQLDNLVDDISMNIINLKQEDNSNAEIIKLENMINELKEQISKLKKKIKNLKESINEIYTILPQPIY